MIKIYSQSLILTFEGEVNRMGLLNIFKEITSMKNDDTMRIGLSSFKLNKKTIENATAHMPSIRNKDIKLSDLMRRTNLY